MKRSIAIAALLALACGGEPEAELELGTPVTLSPVLAVDLADRIVSTGQLLARDHSEIAAEVGGSISEILLDEGSRVEAGSAVLAIDPERRRLERDSARAGFEEARANFREQDREFARMRDLHGRGVASQTRLDQAETARKLASSRLAAAEAQQGVAERALRDATVRAPFAGHVVTRHVSRGEFVQPGQKLFELVALDPIEVEFHVTEVDSGRVASGQTVEVELEPFPDEIFAATVSYVSPTIDVRTRTLRVKAELENPEGRLRPGLFARVNLGISSRENVAMIPEEAILQRADGAVVFRVVAEQRVERVVIETGVHHQGMVEVSSGLRSGDLVVARGQARLVDGARVVPRMPDGTPAATDLGEVAEGSDGAANEASALP